MTGLPVPWTVGVRRYTVGVRDAHGVEHPSWSEPVPVPVHAVGPRFATEPGEPDRWIVVEGLTVYAPAGTTVGPHDRVVWDGDEWEVAGPAADWTRGPWPHPTAGVTFELTRAEG